MEQLGELNYYKILQALKSTGTYDPNEVLAYCGEDLYADEVDTIRDFLQWCHDNKKPFGNGNYEERFAEFLAESGQSETHYVLGEDSINGIKISDTIAEEELFEYNIVDREDFIDTLIGWIAECRSSDKQLMKDDLKMLMHWEDDYIFSSVSTNKYVRQGDPEFNQLCEDLLKLNEEHSDEEI